MSILVKIMRRFEKILFLFIHRKNLSNDAMSHSYEAMKSCVEVYKSFYNDAPSSFLEVGANYFQDAVIFQNLANICDEDIYVIEPNRDIFNQAKDKNPNFNALNIGVSNQKSTLNLFASGKDSSNNGVSSFRARLRDHEWITEQYEVEVDTLDNLFACGKIRSVDVMKIDVEGLTYEVLAGGAEYIDKVKLIHLESENAGTYWHDQQKLFVDIHEFLHKKGFILVYYNLLDDRIQSDSIWARVYSNNNSAS